MLEHLFKNNQNWANNILKEDKDFFKKIETQQTPSYLWIGCSDSRVPANQITGLLPGEVFVHRNIANLVIHTDLNCLSVIQYAVEVLKVKHIMVVGHYGCGGIEAAIRSKKLGLVDNWLRHIQDLKQKFNHIFDHIEEDATGCHKLCELNVIEQTLNVCQTTIIQDAWERQQALTVHSWIYSLKDGLLRDLGLTIDSSANVNAIYQAALQNWALNIEP